jgi:Ser/Thr protein kinase RdoA (MazF antagonist)
VSIARRPFAERSARSQIHQLRRVAQAALADYAITPTSLRLLRHAYNTSFRVDTDDGRRFAMRINAANPKSTEALAAELSWLAALAEDGEVAVPKPLPTKSGALRTAVWSEALDRELPVVMMSWLPGKDLDEPTPTACRALGRLAAHLHEHAARWTMPEGTTLPALSTVFMDVPNRLVLDHPLLTADRREVFDAALERIEATYAAVFAAGPVHPIHADLHGGNVKWLRGRLAVFDFDDAMMGTPLHDLAISAYYLRDDLELEAAVMDGYAEVRPLPEFTTDQFEAFVAGRNLVLLNDVVHLDNAEIRSIAPTYVANAALKLRYFLDTGVFRHDVDGAQPLGF